jgi:LAS superfamily LD-carboxypeptidase LdcB
MKVLAIFLSVFFSFSNLFAPKILTLNPKNEAATPLSTEELLGKFDPEKHADFVRIATEHTTKPKTFLRQATYEAFKKMYAAAKKEGISLTIISATRTFYDQKSIWETKWNKQYANISDHTQRARGILAWSSMPGSSRHHWGTDIDLNDLNDTFFTKNAKGKQIYAWLSAHAHEYGFCQTYSPKGASRPTGYNEEKWHWSYLPLSNDFLTQYKNKVKYEDFKGFLGAETATEVRIIDDYVLGINANCR